MAVPNAPDAFPGRGRRIDAHAVRCPTRRPQLSSVDQLDRVREAIPPWVFPASTGR